MNGDMDDIFGYKVTREKLGRGTFGTVYKGYGNNDTVVAVKMIETDTENGWKDASKEALKCHYLKDEGLQANKNIMKIFDVKYKEKAFYIFMEYCSYGDLDQFFKKHYSQINMDVKVKLMRQIIDGIAFLHQRKIVHRDIKPANILLTSATGNDVVVKLGDFGLTKILDPECLTSAMSSNVGTLAFKSPEFFEDARIKYHRNVDVYASGLTFTAMLQAEPGKSLRPKAEQLGENIVSVGMTAYNRMARGQPDIAVVQNNPKE